MWSVAFFDFYSLCVQVVSMQRAFAVLLADATISESAQNLSSGVLLMACDMVLHLSGKSLVCV